MKLLFSPEAHDDLEALWLAVARNQDSDTADRWLDSVHQRCAGLLTSPEAGPRRDELLPGLRSLAVRPWVVFYRVTSDAVEIVRILHGRRDMAAAL